MARRPRSVATVYVPPIAAIAAGCAAIAAGCAATPEAAAPYWPDRRDYIAFREAYAGILEPNYLPFMVHRFRGEGPEGDVLVLCRWEASAMPIEVAVESAAIPDVLQDEVHPTDAQLFVGRVDYALATWERALEGLVRFRRVGEGAAPDLRIRLLAERAPTPRPDVVVLGATEALLAACRPAGWDPDSDRLRVRFEVPELVVYLADEHGLLTPSQVERVVLHELGHALGMLGHSPMPRDMMFAAYRERSDVETLSEADVNSFVSLYQLPNGVHYGNVVPGAPPPVLPPAPPSGAPELQPAPQVDTARGFSVHLPGGWLWAEGARGLFAANGPVWDHDASLELSVWPYGDVDGFLRRYAAGLFDGAWLRRRGPTRLAGRDGMRIELEDPDARSVYDVRLIPLGDERLLMVVAQSPREYEDDWAPWFEASLATLELADGDLRWE